MNIICNKKVTHDHSVLFKLIEEFFLTYLKDKTLLKKITIYFNEVEDKKDGLAYIGLCTFKPEEPFNPIIKISNYAIQLSHKAYILSNKSLYDTYKKFKYHVIFHELAHIVNTYNDTKLFNIMTQNNNSIFIKEEEELVNKLSDEFLTNKKII